jgi:hypothetical protein
LHRRQASKTSIPKPTAGTSCRIGRELRGGARQRCDWMRLLYIPVNTSDRLSA